jgi:uncharacterized membrane protein
VNAYPPKSSAESTATPSPDEILERNIQALMERRRQEQASVTNHGRVAIAIGHFIGSFGFIYAHIVFFAGWILANTGGLPGLPMFDPELVLVATFAAIEAIFLTTPGADQPEQDVGRRRTPRGARPAYQLVNGA